MPKDTAALIFRAGRVDPPAVSRLRLYRLEHDQIWVCERGRARGLIRCGS